MKTRGILLLMSLLMNSCNNRQDGSPGTAGIDAPTVPIVTQPAAPGDCPAGGTYITIGDSTIIVCNGIDGFIAPVDDEPDRGCDKKKHKDKHGHSHHW